MTQTDREKPQFKCYNTTYSFSLKSMGKQTLLYTANVLSAEIADECLQTKSTNN